MRCLAIVLLFCTLVLGADVYVRIAAPDAAFNYIRFVPSYVTASIGDTLYFYSTDVNNQVVTAAVNGTSGACVNNPALFNVAVSSNTSQPIPITGASFVNGTRYFFKGNTADCQSGIGLKGWILIGSFGFNCTAQTNSSGCGTAGSVPSGPPYKACVWCGASNTEGFCYTPAWSGIENCPCPSCPAADYECPFVSGTFFCGSTCQNGSNPCNSHVRSGSSALVASLLLLLLALLSLS